MKSKSEIVLRALIQGLIIEIQQQEYKFFHKSDTFETNLGNDFIILETGLYIKMTRIRNNITEFIWMIYHISMSDFIKMCESMSNEDIDKIV